MEINLTVILKTKKELIEDVKSNLEQLVVEAIKEKGCLQYELHQNVTNPTIFVFHETWENKELFDLHNSQEYIKDFFNKVPKLLDEPVEILFTNKLA